MTAAHLWLIRHGQTDWNLQGRWQGQTPHAPPLNTTGLAQAHALATTLAQQAAHTPFRAIYSSDLARAHQTAAILAARLGLGVRCDPRLREVNLGAWEGMLGEDVARLYPEMLDERRRNPAHARPPCGETVLELATRMSQALTDIANAHPDENVIIVSHGLAIAAARCITHGIPLAQIFDHLPDHAIPHCVTWRCQCRHACIA
ncbi:MAG: histidine phosphatase family protein [Chloroflexi bacterium]|jgi:broad specificity phosphatase PhoE|uniref:Alpha-ribazole phosphatase n=1 Tax=Candidatus Thermofonsia Clade 3 bacterium TaxID=2364212 RepID=A0A2M8QGW2_9CHLR|nr:histidine phosphatase family protein [Candidatus Roseilinea sp. NK_OTU-006]PJF49008.1 MAG: hypothetical protein CUN48_00665 [Candidatus Thermofonsia Clade 3 bacterium]RMG63410.1 MAG: histidine phosphatase family protein [Chloroflexota bacterium]